MYKLPKSSQGGFTLVEIMVSVGVFSILLAKMIATNLNVRFTNDPYMLLSYIQYENGDTIVADKFEFEFEEEENETKIRINGELITEYTEVQFPPYGEKVTDLIVVAEGSHCVWRRGRLYCS